MSPADVSALQAGNLSLSSAAAVITQPATLEGEPLGLPDDLMSEGYACEIAVLRNPGLTVYVLREVPGSRPVDPEDVQALAREHNAALLQSKRIPVITGPDGVTPMVMKPVQRYRNTLPEESLQPQVIDYNAMVDVFITLMFPFESKAQEAAKYIDKGFYQVSVTARPSGAKLVARCRMPLGALYDERNAFAPLARRFGGRVASVHNHDKSQARGEGSKQ